MWSVGKVGERKVRDEVGRGPEYIGPRSLQDINAHALEQPQHYPQGRKRFLDQPGRVQGKLAGPQGELL